MPTAIDQDAPNPAVSQIDPAATVPNSQPRDPRQADKKDRKKGKDRSAAAATPGFSL